MTSAEAQWPAVPLADEIRTFIEAAVVAGDLTLPVHYPKLAEIAGLQSGFRSHGLTGQLLVSSRPGDWQPDWLVVALNGMDDPFFVDLREEASGFPVYYAPRGAGRWDAVRAAESLRRFTSLLTDLREVEDDDARAMQRIATEADVTNPLWSEVLQARSERDAVEQDVTTADHDPADHEQAELVITDFGAHKLKVVQIIRRVLHLSLPQALGLASERDVIVAAGPRIGLHHLQRELASAGAVTKFRAAHGGTDARI